MFSQGKRFMAALANKNGSPSKVPPQSRKPQPKRTQQERSTDVAEQEESQKGSTTVVGKNQELEERSKTVVGKKQESKEGSTTAVGQNQESQQTHQEKSTTVVGKKKESEQTQQQERSTAVGEDTDSDSADSEYTPSECDVLNSDWPPVPSHSENAMENETPCSDNETPRIDNEKTPHIRKEIPRIDDETPSTVLAPDRGWCSSSERKADFPAAPIAIRQNVSSNYTPDEQNMIKSSNLNIRKRLFPASQSNAPESLSVIPLESFTYQQLMPVEFNNGFSLEQAHDLENTVNRLNPVTSSAAPSASTLGDMFNFESEDILTVSHDSPHEADEVVVAHSPVQADKGTLPEDENEMDVAPQGEEIVQVGLTPKKRTRNASAHNGSPTRKKIRNPKGWIVSQAKLAYNSGLAHITSKGKERKQREMKEGCSAKCRKKCQNRITNTRRQKIFETYYSSASKEAQWLMLGKMAKTVPVKRRILPGVSSPHRKFSYSYYLTDDDGNQVPVCQTMFLATFDISISVVQNALKKNSPDKRGKQTLNRPKRVPQELKLSVTNHIKSFPKIESHYCRESSTRQYLQENLSISKMYRMYITERGKDTPHTATYRQYRDIFNYCFNLGFYQPKKDQCSVCANWKHLPVDVQEGNSEVVLEYHEHVAAKEVARSFKQKSKDLSRSEQNKDGKIKVICFDLQKVFFCPKSEVGDFFYKSKVACYNFTIFDCTLKKATCYVWDQTIGGRGSAEISSCVLKYIQQEATNGVNEFHIYSDSCWSQNKNQFLYSMYYLASQKLAVKIIHRYLEKGHTQMECDSVHASIEKKIKNTEIFTPLEWYGFIRTAKVNKPHYTVVQVKQEDIVSFTGLSEGYFAWHKVSVSKFHEIIIDSQTPGTITYKEKLCDQETKFTVLLKKPGRPVAWSSYKPPQAYPGLLAPKPKLVKDLKWMLEKNLIPDRAVQFYQALTSPTFGMAITPEGQVPDEDDVPQMVHHDGRRLDSLLESNNDNVEGPDREL